VGNNPLTRWDPTGHDWRSVLHKVSGALDAIGDTITFGGYSAFNDSIGNEASDSDEYAESYVNTATTIYVMSDNLNALAPGEGLIVEASIAASFRVTGLAEESVLRAMKYCNCFVAGTKVLTDEGEKNIEDIKVGDKVLSKDEETGEVAYKEVTATFNHETDEIYNIHVGGQTIESTYNHPFYVAGKGWTFVKDLKVGDLLVQSDGNTLRIDSIELLHKYVTVYNMTVDEFHTYFVSDIGIWVHNSNCNWSRVNWKGETAIEHVNLHGKDDLSKPLHGVFADDPIQTVEKAMDYAKQNNIQALYDSKRNNYKYVIPYTDAGLEGGYNGSSMILNHVTVIVEDTATNKIITAFPSK